MEAAYHTLTQLFLPMWRRHAARRRWDRAIETMRRYVPRAVRRRRAQKRAAAANLIHGALAFRVTALMYAVRELATRVCVVQRVYRRHQQRVAAVIELNLRKIRRDVEARYWSEVVARREAELDALAEASHLAEEVRSAATKEPTTRSTSTRVTTTSATRRHLQQPSNVSYELDVYNYFMIGPLPETILKSELRFALYAHLRRTMHNARDVSSYEWLCKQREESVPAHDGQSAGCGSRGRSAKRAGTVMPTFLPSAVYIAVMDNTCFVASQIRDDPMLRAHLRGRARNIVVY